MKKVLIIGLTERMGGVETFIYNTTRFSDPSKYTYDFLIHGADHCVFQKEINEFYGDNTHIHFIRKFKSNPFGCIRDLILFYKKYGKDIDIVHLQTGSTAEVLYVFPYCIFQSFKVISHSHNGNGYSTFINRLFRPIVNAVSKKRLACSDVAADWLFGKHNRKKTVMINNGIDTNRFAYDEIKRAEIRTQYQIDDCFVVGHIGRFAEQKNHEFILEIFSQVYKRKSNARLLLVGEGEKEEQIRTLCRQLNLEKAVIFAGKHPRTEDYYSAFDVFLMPSLYEGLPIVGIEAQSEGLPCFFSDQISEQIKLTDLANIHSLSESAEVWAEYILNCSVTHDRKIYPDKIREKKFDIQSTVATLENIYLGM